MLALLMLSVGAVVDVGRWLHARSQAQQALTAAALAGGRMLQIAGWNQELAIGSARQTFAQNMTGAFDVSLETLSFEVSPDGATFSVRATAWLPTTLLRVVGIHRLPVLAPASRHDVTSGASRGTSYEVAVALDLSDGMSAPWVDNLKLALRDFVDIVVWPQQGEVVARIALVPFGETVAVGGDPERITGTLRSGLCRVPGCEQFEFRKRGATGCAAQVSPAELDGGDCRQRIFSAGPCVVERSGAEAFSSASPGIAPLDVAYANGQVRCRPGGLVQPLTADRELLHRAVAELQQGGNSAPQVGMAWAWYLLSPEWNALWPRANGAWPWSDLGVQLANRNAKLRKFAVLVQSGTDVVQHCQGIDDRLIDCPAPNGRSVEQTRRICNNMRQAGVAIFVVGVELQRNRDLEEVLRDHCAGQESAYYEVHNAEQIRQALRDIALQISPLVETR